MASPDDGRLAIPYFRDVAAEALSNAGPMIYSNRYRTVIAQAFANFH
jgi:hypothetical protein